MNEAAKMAGEKVTECEDGREGIDGWEPTEGKRIWTDKEEKIEADAGEEDVEREHDWESWKDTVHAVTTFDVSTSQGLYPLVSRVSK